MGVKQDNNRVIKEKTMKKCSKIKTQVNQRVEKALAALEGASPPAAEATR